MSISLSEVEGMLREQRANLEKLEADATATRGALQVLEYQARRLRAAEDLPCPKCGKSNAGTTRAEFAAAAYIPTVWCEHCHEPSGREAWLGEVIGVVAPRVVYTCGFCPEGCYHETREEARECAEIAQEDPPEPPDFAPPRDAGDEPAAEDCERCHSIFTEEWPRDAKRGHLCVACAEFLKSLTTSPAPECACVPGDGSQEGPRPADFDPDAHA